MNRKAHHIRLYKRLYLHDSATIADLKKSYRQLASKYHPDKTTQSELGSINADLFNNVQTAYRELKKFYEHHGHLPLDPDFNSDEHADTQTSKPSPGAHRPGAIPRLSYILSGLLILLLFILIFLPYPENRSAVPPHTNASKDEHLKPDDDPVSSTTPHTRHTPTRAEFQKQPITIGLSMGQVFDLLGVPDSTINNQWFYGASEIYFRDGYVAGWNNDPKTPIWTDKSLPSHVTPQPGLR